MIGDERWKARVTVSLLALMAMGCSSSSDGSEADGPIPATSTGSGTSGAGAGPTGSTAASASGGSNADSGVSNSGASDVGGASGGDAGGAGGTGGELPYANVVAVTPSGESGSYTFNVSVESSDIDCTQFADWWEVVAEDGSLLYRRILDHSHTDENGSSDPDAPGNTFTRSGGPVPVTGDQPVFVRAHLSTLDEYRGSVMYGSVDDGFTVSTTIAPDFASDLVSAPPQPEGCLF